MVADMCIRYFVYFPKNERNNERSELFIFGCILTSIAPNVNEIEERKDRMSLNERQLARNMKIHDWVYFGRLFETWLFDSCVLFFFTLLYFNFVTRN